MNKLGIPLAALALGSWAAAAGPIRSFTLDENVVRDIGVSRSHVTTIAFPGPLQALDAANVTTDPAKPGFFQLAYQPGNAFLSVQALRQNQEANVNVVYNRKTYVLRLIETNEPVLAVQFTEPVVPPVALRRTPLTPSRLLGVLQTAKAYPFLARQQPEALRGVTVATPTRLMDYGDFTLHMPAVWRFDAEDALVFHVRMTNRTDQEIRYQPASLGVRVGERQFSSSLADASGVMPPRVTSEAFFVVAGAPDGGRNELSPKNDFTVLLTRPTHSAK